MKHFTLSFRGSQVSKLFAAISATAIVTTALLTTMVVPTQALEALEAPDICILRQKHVKAGAWRTLESYWNATGHGYFREPAGAEIKVLYGASWLSKDRQKQRLDGINIKKLEIGAWSVSYARIQIKVSQDTDVNYLSCSGGIAKSFPTIPF
jgi:hypothetical protein